MPLFHRRPPADPAKRRRPLGGVLGRLRRDRRGATAVEFAVIAGPFIYLLLGGVEIALVNLTYSSMQNGMHNAMRGVQTGGAGCVTADQIKTEVCNSIKSQNNSSCRGSMKLVLEELTSFNSSGSDMQQNYDDIDDGASAGDADSVMLMQVVYRWNAITPLLANIAGGSGGYIHMHAAVAFKNEPYGETDGCVLAPVT